MYPLKHIIDDGGRKAAGFDSPARLGDCVTRAVAIATGQDYAKAHKAMSRLSPFQNADYGVLAPILGIYLRLRGFRKVTDEKIITTKHPHLRKGTFVCFCKLTGKKVFGLFHVGHAFAVKDGALRDTYDVRYMDHKIVAVYEKVA